MKTKLIISIFAALVLFTACNKDSSKDKTDDLLIEAIINANNKESIDFDNLPMSSKDILNTEYANDFVFIFLWG